MIPQYRIVNECLPLLKQAEIPSIKKLRIEIQLIQLKRLLLHESGPDWSCDQETLSEVLSDLRKIRDGECGVDAVSDLTKRLGGIIEGFPVAATMIPQPQSNITF